MFVCFCRDGPGRVGGGLQEGLRFEDLVHLRGQAVLLTVQGVESTGKDADRLVFFLEGQVGLAVQVVDQQQDLVLGHRAGVLPQGDLLLLEPGPAGVFPEGDPGLVGQGLAGDGNGDGPFRADLVVVDVGSLDQGVVGDEVVDAALEIVLPHHLEGGDHAGDQDEGQDAGGDALAPARVEAVELADGLEVQVLDGQVGGQDDEDAVDDEEEHRPGEVVPAQVREAVSGRAQGRHQGGGDGHAGQDGTPLLAAVLQDAGEAAEEGDQHVVDGRRRAGVELRRGDGLQRGDDVEERGEDQRHDDHDEQVHRGELQELGVSGPQRQAHADDRPHQRGDEHRADDDGRGIDAQAGRSDHDRAGKDPDVGAAEGDGRADPVAGRDGVHLALDPDDFSKSGEEVLPVGLHAFKFSGTNIDISAVVRSSFFS